jgi:hypothetical protein
MTVTEAARELPRWRALFVVAAAYDASHASIGGSGDQVEWVRIAPTGRVWVLLTDWSNELDASLYRLVPVAEDAALAP